MATVKGPLFSLGASGTIAGAVVFSTWKGRPYVRVHAVPANPKSQSQVSMRAVLKFLSQAWDALTDAVKAAWETLAAATNISPFNAYIAWNQTRWGLNTPPAKQPPAGGTGVEAAIDTESATAGIRSVTFAWRVTAANDNWGVNIYRDDETMPTQNRNLLIAAVPCADAQDFSYLDVGLTPGTEYFYRIQPFTDDAKMVAWYA